MFGTTKKMKTDYIATDSEKALLSKIMTRYRSAYQFKQGLGLDSLWADCNRYWAGDINYPEDDDDPGSETNIIQPIIESQVADIVNDDIDILVKGVGPSDQDFAKDTQQILKWIWYHNDMLNKLDSSERDRLNLGTIIWKVMWDKLAISGKGIPAMIPLSPDCFFPDPKVTDCDLMQDADFIIQTGFYSRRKLIQLFGDKAKLVKPNAQGNSYDPRIFGEDNSATDEVLNDQALLYEYWEKDEDGKLRLVYCTQELILADSDKDDDNARIPDIQDYPFVPIVGYKVKGRLWGQGDTEQLIPIQDVINDLDDQIRMNARLMGNSQMVVGTGAGINIKKWTNKPGLKIPAKDHTAWSTVQPPYMPAYINNRREKAFSESELVSGRSDVVEGRRSGSLRAASAIMALQEAGSRRANHKKLMLQNGLKKVNELVLAYAKEFMTIEQAFDITEKGETNYLWFRASDLKNIPQLTYNENYNPDSDDVDNRGRYKTLYDEPTTDEEGNMIPAQPMTKDAEFDIEIHMGAGMPNNKSFLYEASVELHRENIITTEETRAVLKQTMNWPIIDPYSPSGMFSGRNSSAEQLDIANGQTGNQQQQEVPNMSGDLTGQIPGNQSIDPNLLAQLTTLLKSGNVDPQQLYGLISQLPENVQVAILQSLQGGNQ